MDFAITEIQGILLQSWYCKGQEVLLCEKKKTHEQPLNYARNYLVYLLEPCLERVIYLNSDVILVSDISKLWRINLASATVGSPEYCHVNLTQIFTANFWSQTKFSWVFSGRNPCYFNKDEVLYAFKVFQHDLFIDQSHLRAVVFTSLLKCMPTIDTMQNYYKGHKYW